MGKTPIRVSEELEKSEGAIVHSALDRVTERSSKF
jgi:hypothetical protein